MGQLIVLSRFGGSPRGLRVNVLMWTWISVVLCAARAAATPNVAISSPNTSPALTEELLSAGKRCVFSPKPDYALTVDEDDSIQLTDGIRHSGEIWHWRGVVGWVGAPARKYQLWLARFKLPRERD